MKPAAGRGHAYILLPTDFQPPARRAFMYGVKLATAWPARLEILHVIKTATDSPDAVPDSRYVRSLKTSALLNLGRLAREAKEEGAHAQPLLRYGVPSVCILDVVKQVHAEMIVIGTEGRTGWDRLRLGSTAQAIVREAPCPVLTLHGSLPGDVARHPARIRLQRLLVATDFSTFAGAALQAVCELAGKFKAAVSLLHAAESSADGPQAERMLAQLVKNLRRQGIAAEGVCVAGDPVEMILAQAAAWQADLIAVGTRGRQGLSRVVMGSVAEALLKRAGCPVLTVGRPRRRAGVSQGSKGQMRA
jgi:nucleotide-binding universal stress UspA family protein